MSNLKLISGILLAMLFMWTIAIAYKTGRQVTDRWYAQHETCFSKDEISFSGNITSFSATLMTGTAYVVGLNNGETIVSIDYDGKVHFGKHMTADKASRAFWEKMGYDFRRCRRSEPRR